MNIVKRLWPFLRPYQASIYFTLFLGLVLSGVSLAQAHLVRFMFDDVFTKKDPRMLTLLPLAIIGIYVVSGVVRFFHMFLLRYTGERVGFDIRNELQARFANLSLGFHNANTSGALISKTTNDVINIQLGLTLFADIVKEPLTAVALLGYMIYLDWKLTLFALVAAPVLIVASRNLGRSVRKYSLVQQEMLEKFTNVLKETLDGIRIVKAFSLEGHMQKRFQKVTQDILGIRRKILRREEVAGPIFELLAAITFAAILYYAGFRIISGQSTPGAFMSFVVALMSLQGPIKKLQDAHVRLQHTVAAGSRVFEVLDTPVTVKDPEDLGREASSWPDDWKTITFENVNFSYADTTILKNLNLTVNRGEMIAIVGPSGAGKTTLVNLLPRFYDVTGGAIRVGSIDIRALSLRELRRRIGLVTQDVFLFNESIRENILAGNDDHRDGKVETAVGAAHAAQFVESFPEKLNTMVGERGARLSGGERQRISIARAIFKDAPILILDEATSSLDSESEKLVQKALDELMVGRTTFVIAHRLSTIQKADRIVVLSGGQVAEQGSHSQLLNQDGIYRRLHANQFDSVVALDQ